MNSKKISEPEFRDEEIARRRDEVIRRMANTPPKPHSAIKLGKRMEKASQKENPPKKRGRHMKPTEA